MNIPPKNLSSPIRELWVNEGALASRPLLLFDTDQHYSSIGNNAGRTRDRERRSEAFSVGNDGYSTFILAAFTIGHHLSISDR